MKTRDVRCEIAGFWKRENGTDCEIKNTGRPIDSISYAFSSFLHVDMNGKAKLTFVVACNALHSSSPRLSAYHIT